MDVQLAITYGLHLPLSASMDANGNGCPSACEPTCDTMQCDDGVSCTLDLCYEPVGCVFEPDDTLCEPTQGPCVSSECVPGLGCAVRIQDGPCAANDCTDGMCDPAGCIATTLKSAPDNCQADACSEVVGCDPATGCELELVDCDTDECTKPDTCGPSGQCVPGSEVSCTDSNGCTDELCDPIVGCQFVPNSAPCDDGNPCTVGDRCAGGDLCWGTSPPGCDDAYVCTIDGCGAAGCNNTVPPLWQAMQMGMPTPCHCCDNAGVQDPTIDGCADSQCIACVESNLLSWQSPGSCVGNGVCSDTASYCESDADCPAGTCKLGGSFSPICRTIAREKCFAECGCTKRSCCSASGSWGCDNTACEQCVSSKVLAKPGGGIYSGWLCSSEYYVWTGECVQLAVEQCADECGCCPVELDSCSADEPRILAVGGAVDIALSPGLPLDSVTFLESAVDDLSIETSTSQMVSVIGMEKSREAGSSMVVARYSLPTAPQTMCETGCPITVYGVKAVDFVPIATGGAVVDEPGIRQGKRLYPDSTMEEAVELNNELQTPDVPSRNRVGVRVEVDPPVEGATIYLRAFDVDDPSSSDWPVDCSDWLNGGAPTPNDNRGRVEPPIGSPPGTFPGDALPSAGPDDTPPRPRSLAPVPAVSLVGSPHPTGCPMRIPGR